MDTETLAKINKFTRREFTEDEIYTFSVILCDNEIDRDCERFSDNALEQICSLFIGKTGISDHDPSASNQTARIFDTKLITDEARTTKYGSPYKYVKAYAYMVRTTDNRDLIAEIDGGIKKEVSISCSAAKRICSICGCDKSVQNCGHKSNKLYGKNLCHTVLDDIKDAYEWSFVAVPAQVNAGVTKHYSSEQAAASPAYAILEKADEELRRDIRRLAYFSGGKLAADTVAVSSKNMDTSQLLKLKKALEAKRSSGGIEIQLEDQSGDNDNTSDFSMR